MASLEREDPADDVFMEKCVLSPLSSSLPIKAEIMPGIAELHVSSVCSGKINTMLSPA